MKILLFGLLFSFISCQSKAKSTNYLLYPLADVQDTMQLSGNKNPKKAFSFPKNVKTILPAMPYRKEGKVYPITVKGKDWYEIYKDTKTNQWKIRKADLKISYGFDECAGVDIMTIHSKHKNSVLFFTPFDGLNQNPITLLEDKSLIPRKEIGFIMNGNNYELSLSGKIYNEEGNPNSETKSFTLSFSSEKVKKYSIAVMSERSDDTPKIIWAGDLNDDGLPDMILDLSEDYESRHIFFFLSDKNDKQKPLKKVGDAWVVFDC